MTRRRSVPFVLLWLAGVAGIAQDPVATNAGYYAAVFDNERVRILDCQDEPGDKTTLHADPDSIRAPARSMRSAASGRPAA